ncbi:hypothetical protein DMENIID0001_135920 [Sergentomyia squamirostris]
MSSNQPMNVQWNNHLNSLGTAFPRMFSAQRFVDVTLACEGRRIHCHRVVLAACSSYFEELLEENPAQHPIIILTGSIRFWALEALVEFMYRGEVSINEEDFEELVKFGEILQIHSLQRRPVVPPEMNLDQKNLLEIPDHDALSYCEISLPPVTNEDPETPQLESVNFIPPTNLSPRRKNTMISEVPEEFVLPRMGRHRSFNSKSMWAALMDIKLGGSMTRASKVHKIPAGTLHAYMKRYGIRSQFIARSLPTTNKIVQKKRRFRRNNKQEGAGI